MDREKLMKDLQGLQIQKAKYEGAIEYIAQKLVELDRIEAEEKKIKEGLKNEKRKNVEPKQDNK